MTQTERGLAVLGAASPFPSYSMTVIEKVLQSEASPKSFLFKHLWVGHFSGLRDNGVSSCSGLVGTCGLRTKHLTPDSHGGVYGVALLFRGFCRWQLRPPLLGFFGFVPSVVQFNQIPYGILRM